MIGPQSSPVCKEVLAVLAQPVTCFGFIADLAPSSTGLSTLSPCRYDIPTLNNNRAFGGWPLVVWKTGLPFKYSLDSQLIILLVYFCRNGPGPIEAYDESLTAIVWQLLVRWLTSPAVAPYECDF